MTRPPSSSNTGYCLAHLASRLRDDKEFMASALSVYKIQERLSDEALAQRLGLQLEMITRLALCKRPQSNTSNFADQVRQLAAYIDIDASKIAQLIRQVEALEIMGTLSKSESSSREAASQTEGMGWLTAARDRIAADGDHVKDVDKTEEIGRAHV